MKTNNYVAAERLVKALANRRRLAIAAFLKKSREANVTDIAGAINLSVTSTSKHLSILAFAGMVEKEQRSLEMFYSIASPLPPMLSAILNHV